MEFKVGDIVRRKQGKKTAIVLRVKRWWKHDDVQVRWDTTGKAEWVHPAYLCHTAIRDQQKQDNKGPIMNFDLTNIARVRFGDMSKEMQDAYKLAHKKGRLKFYDHGEKAWRKAGNPTWSARAKYSSDALIPIPFVKKEVKTATLQNDELVAWGDMPVPLQKQFDMAFWQGEDVQVFSNGVWKHIDKIDRENPHQVLRVVGVKKAPKAAPAPLPEPVQAPEDDIDWAAIKPKYKYLVRGHTGTPYITKARPKLRRDGSWEAVETFHSIHLLASYKNNGRPYKDSLVCRPGFEDV